VRARKTLGLCGNGEVAAEALVEGDVEAGGEKRLWEVIGVAVARRELSRRVLESKKMQERKALEPGSPRRLPRPQARGGGRLMGR
jgi:hypothetical protein